MALNLPPNHSPHGPNPSPHGQASSVCFDCSPNIVLIHLQLSQGTHHTSHSIHMALLVTYLTRAYTIHHSHHIGHLRAPNTDPDPDPHPPPQCHTPHSVALRQLALGHGAIGVAWCCPCNGQGISIGSEVNQMGATQMSDEFLLVSGVPVAPPTANCSSMC